jgi:hypothetical protein
MKHISQIKMPFFKTVEYNNFFEPEVSNLCQFVWPYSLSLMVNNNQGDLPHGLVPDKLFAIYLHHHLKLPLYTAKGSRFSLEVVLSLLFRATNKRLH